MNIIFRRPPGIVHGILRDHSRKGCGKTFCGITVWGAGLKTDDEITCKRCLRSPNEYLFKMNEIKYKGEE